MPTAWEREQERESKARYLAEREAETRRLNELIDQRIADLNNILSAGLSHSVVLDHNARKLFLPVFDASGLDLPYAEPTLKDFPPREPGAFTQHEAEPESFIPLARVCIQAPSHHHLQRYRPACKYLAAFWVELLEDTSGWQLACGWMPAMPSPTTQTYNPAWTLWRAGWTRRGSSVQPGGTGR